MSVGSSCSSLIWFFFFETNPFFCSAIIKTRKSDLQFNDIVYDSVADWYIHTRPITYKLEKNSRSMGLAGASGPHTLIHSFTRLCSTHTLTLLEARDCTALQTNYCCVLLNGNDHQVPQSKTQLWRLYNARRNDQSRVKK